jgi:hypothetical protein
MPAGKVIVPLPVKRAYCLRVPKILAAATPEPVTLARMVLEDSAQEVVVGQ